MRQMGAWGLSIALLMAFFGSEARAADPPWRRASPKPAQESSSGGWFSGWLGSKDRSADKQTAAAKQPANWTKTNELAKDRVDTEKARAAAAFLRRMAVCDKLKQVAFDSGNEALQHMADDLLERAQTAYSQRLAQLPSSPDGFESDEHSLEKHLGPNRASSKQSNRENTRDGRTAARKERP